MPGQLEFQQGIAAAICRPTLGALRVYRNTVISGQIQALRDNYPVVAALLGEEMFTAAAVDYAQDCPQRSPLLANYGTRFPDWIAEQVWAANLPYLADVAKVERLHLEAGFAADGDALEPQRLSLVGDWNRLRLRLHPAARFDWLAAPGFSIWQAHQAGVPNQIEIDWTAEGVLFSRPGWSVQAMPIDRPAHRLLAGIRFGETVGASATASVKLYPDADIGGQFASLVQAGAFAALPPERT